MRGQVNESTGQQVKGVVIKSTRPDIKWAESKSAEPHIEGGCQQICRVVDEGVGQKIHSAASEKG